MINSIQEAVEFAGYRFGIIPNSNDPVLETCVASSGSNTFQMVFVVAKSLLVPQALPDHELNDLTTLFYNNIWPVTEPLQNEAGVRDFIRNNFPDRSPGAKADRLLLFIHAFTQYDGEKLDLIMSMNNANKYWRDLYFSNSSEFEFYFDFLVRNDFLDVPFKDTQELDRSFPKDRVWLTVKGLEKVIAAEEQKMSKTCFVAMSFAADMQYVYEHAIAPAIRESDFEPLKIDDDANISSEQTINDAILAAIKKSKFTIADFTGHRAGVYFEAGYALGRGHKVIYTCREDQINEAHFDTRNYPHIVWKDAEDLKKQLVNKIEVFIKG
jgi:hypothetical protein